MGKGGSGSGGGVGGGGSGSGGGVGGGGGEAGLATATVGHGRGGGSAARVDGSGASGGGGGHGGDRFVMARKDGNAERMIGLMVTSARSAAESAVHTRHRSLRGRNQAFVCACASSEPWCAPAACISLCIAAPPDECATASSNGAKRVGRFARSSVFSCGSVRRSK